MYVLYTNREINNIIMIEKDLIKSGAHDMN